MKKIIILLGIISLMIFAVGCNRNTNVVGNNDEEILQYLKEGDLLDNIGKENLTIVDTVNIDNSKIVGFASDRGHGYLVFEKNEKGNYVMTNNRATGIDSNGAGVSHSIVLYNLNSFDDRDVAYMVISDGSTASQVEMTVNEHVFNEKLEIGKPSMVVIHDVLSESEANEMISFNCRYFDINNEELKEE
ncbi:MAG: hypothetical protein ACRCX2_12190, partial [Paraclostridium sp.]